MIQQHGRHDRPSTRSTSWKSMRFVPARLSFFAIIVSSPASFAQSAPTCQLPAHSISLSQPGAPQGATEVHVEDSSAGANLVYGVIHLNLRNDGPSPLSELCASIHLSNSDGSPLDASAALSA